MNASTSLSEGQRLNAILTDFLQSNHTLVEIADFHKMTVLELLEWARQPKVKEVLDAVFSLSRQRIRTIRAEARITSLRRLDLIAASSDHEETARRAAMGLLRGSSPRRKRVPPAAPSLREEPAAASPSSDAPSPAMKASLPDSAGASDIAGPIRLSQTRLDDPTSPASPVIEGGSAESARRRGIQREPGPAIPSHPTPAIRPSSADAGSLRSTITVPKQPHPEDPASPKRDRGLSPPAPTSTANPPNRIGSVRARPTAPDLPTRKPESGNGLDQR